MKVGKSLKFTLILMLATLITYHTLIAQSQGEYLSEEILPTKLRKSISFFNELLVLPGVTISGEQASMLLNKLYKELVMPRFDINPLPKDLTNKLRSAISGIRSVTEFRTTIERILVPEIVKILHVEKEMRAKKFVSEEERINFLTTKAKGVGVTADDLEKVMNSAYLCFPYIRKFQKTKEKKSENFIRIRYFIEGGIIWYRISTRTHPPKIIPIANILVDKEGYMDEPLEKEKRCDELAYAMALSFFVRTLGDLSRSLPEFSIKGEITSVGNSMVELDIGKYEGVTLGDEYDIWELTENEEGGIEKKVIGFARISSVKDKTSTAIIVGGSPQKGMFVTEAPITFEVSGGISMLPIKIQDRETGDKSSVTPGFSGILIGKIGAPFFKFFRPYFGLGAYIGLPIMTNQLIWYAGLEMPILIQFYIRKFEMGIGCTGKLGFANKGKFSNMGGGLELIATTGFILNRNMVFGVRGGIGFGTESDEWEYKEDDKTFKKYGPVVSHSYGLNVGFYLKRLYRH